MYDNLSEPILILIRGLPGSGKTYLTNALVEYIKTASVVVLDPDATDYTTEAYKNHVLALTEQGVDAKLHPYRFLRAQAYEGIRTHKLIIWNQPFSNTEMFEKIVNGLHAYAQDSHTALHVLVVEVAIDIVAAKDRVNTRKRAGGHGPSENTFKRFQQEYTSLMDANYTVVQVDGTHVVTESIATIVRVLDGFTAHRP